MFWIVFRWGQNHALNTTVSFQTESALCVCRMPYRKQSGPSFSQKALLGFRKRKKKPSSTFSIPPPTFPLQCRPHSLGCWPCSGELVRVSAVRGETQWNLTRFNLSEIIPPFSVYAPFRFPAYKNYFWVPWRLIDLFFFLCKKVVHFGFFFFCFCLGSNFILVDLNIS